MSANRSSASLGSGCARLGSEPKTASSGNNTTSTHGKRCLVWATRRAMRGILSSPQATCICTPAMPIGRGALAPTGMEVDGAAGVAADATREPHRSPLEGLCGHAFRGLRIGSVSAAFLDDVEGDHSSEAAEGRDWHQIVGPGHGVQAALDPLAEYVGAIKQSF